MSFYKLTFIILITFLFSSCKVGPDYVKPTVVLPNQFKEAKNKKVITSIKDSHWKIARPQDTCHRGEWWRLFKDKELNRLENLLNAHNQTIIGAEANYRQAYAILQETRASYYPSIDGALSITRQKGSGSSSFISTSTAGTTSSGSAITNTATGSRVFSNHSWLLNASWEPDIWGLVRRTVEADAAGAQSSAALTAVTRLSAQGSLAQFYFQLRALDTDQKILNETVASYKKALQLTRNQYHSGVAANADIVQAESQLESAQALAINNGINRALYEHAIAVLIGIPPAEFKLPFRPLKQESLSIPISVPSTLLERRPDIAQAERLMAQANAQIGVAVAAFYPTISLTGTLNSAANNAGLAQLFSVPTLGWSYGPQFTQFIYDGGLRSATVAAAKAGYESTVASYRQTVLTAFQDVEDNLVSLRLLNKQIRVQNLAAISAKKALRLVLNQYKAGTVVYSNVITAQINAFAAEKNAADVAGLRMTAAVGLIKALGGGWNASDIEHAAE